MQASDSGGDGHPPATTITLVIVHAALVAAAHPGIGAWPLAFVALVPLAWVALHARSLRIAALVTFVAHLGLWLWMERWMAGVTALGYPLEAAYMAAWAPLALLVLGRVARFRRTRRLPMAILLPVVWTAFEVLRGELLFHGYPWYLLGHPLVEWPALVQIAEATGAYGASFLAAAAAGAIVDVLRTIVAAPSWWRPRTATLSAACTGMVLVGATAFGLWRIDALQAAEAPRTLTVLGIQTNLPQSNKIGWPVEQQRLDVAAFIDLTRRAFAESGGADVVVWPETMLPIHGFEPETLATVARVQLDHELEFAGAVRDLAEELGVPMLVGAPSYHGLRIEQDPERPGYARFAWDRHHNSAYLVTGSGPYQRYDKVHLTPFGEEIPYIAAWPWLEQQLSALAAGGMTLTLDPADTITRLAVPFPGSADAAFLLGTPICFEDGMGRVCRRMVYENGAKSADALVNLSNDGWYGPHDAGREQHAQIARFRAIENRVPMLRCVNTGYSVAIDAAGNVVARIGDGRYGGGRRDGWIRAELAACTWTTLFGRVGNAFGWTCVLGAFVALIQTFHQPRMGWDSTT